MKPDPDATIQIRRGGASPKLWRVWLAAGLSALVLTGGGWAGWQMLRPHAAPPIMTASRTINPPDAVPPPSEPVQQLPLATEAEILASHSGSYEEYRFQPQPNVIVVHFATLADQASALNRAAAMVEKAGYPRDRVLDQAELERRIKAEGSTPETFYYGHDYRAADVLRFFDAIDRSGTGMSAGEAMLRQRVAAWGWKPGINAAMISLVQADEAAGLSRPVRATILRHELSHGLYFTSSAYAHYSHEFWDSEMTGAERAQFRSFLANEGYDTGLDDLIVNETQAYLMHTANKQFFNAQAVGIPEARLNVLRGLFLTGMPPSWLRDCTSVPLRAPRRRPSRRRSDFSAAA